MVGAVGIEIIPIRFLLFLCFFSFFHFYWGALTGACLVPLPLSALAWSGCRSVAWVLAGPRRRACLVRGAVRAFRSFAASASCASCAPPGRGTLPARVPRFLGVTFLVLMSGLSSSSRLHGSLPWRKRDA